LHHGESILWLIYTALIDSICIVKGGIDKPKDGFSMMQAGEVFEHAMLREIYEQPRALADTIEHYAPNGKLATEVFQPVADALRGRARLVIAASGSSRHAGLAAEIMLEDLAGLIVDGEYARGYG